MALGRHTFFDLKHVTPTNEKHFLSETVKKCQQQGHKCKRRRGSRQVDLYSETHFYTLQKNWHLKHLGMAENGITSADRFVCFQRCNSTLS